jgi:transposase
MGRKAVSKNLRWQICGMLQDPTKTNVEIARIFNVSEKCVRTCKKNFSLYCSPVPKISGRPKKTTTREENWIHRQLRINPRISYRDLTKVIKQLESLC